MKGPRTGRQGKTPMAQMPLRTTLIITALFACSETQAPGEPAALIPAGTAASRATDPEPTEASTVNGAEELGH